MKSRIYSLFAAAIFSLLLFAKSVSAQDYQAIKTDASYYFKSSTGSDVIALRVDSVVQSGGVNTYYNFRQIRQTDYGCWTTNGASWLGDKIVEYPDGKTQFILYPFSPPTQMMFTQSLPRLKSVSRGDFTIIIIVSNILKQQ